MYKKILSLILAIITVLSLSVTVYGVTIEHKDSKGNIVKLNDFLDTKGHWAHDTILKCAEYGLVAGNNGNFMPNKPIKRGDLCIILDRMLGLTTTSYNIFNDLPNDSYYRDAILRCVAAGYVTGTSSNTVSPEGFATREQVAVIICRMFNIDTYTSYTTFADDAQIGAWAKPSVAAMKRLGYMNGTGDNMVKPKSNITRAELITMINNIANTYIPKTDSTSQGNSFRGEFPTNLVTSRNISLNNSTIGRDLIITPASSGVTLTNTKIMGRILAMGKAFITLDNSSATKIHLVEGKSSVTGIEADNVSEVYIGQYASESSLDFFPKKLVLESGVRVRVSSTMYENNTTTTKVYYGKELMADIAAEQGSVIGGPKISGESFTHIYDNTVSVTNAKITAGDSKIVEIGVLWLDQEDDEDTVIPNYKNCDGKTTYDSDKIGLPISFDVGKVRGTRAYRMYVKDEDGLFAYGKTEVFTAYDFDLSLKIYDNQYPEKVDVELVMQGDNLPPIRSIRVVHASDELYNEKHDEIGLRLYTDPNAENPIDENKYRRYIATIVSRSVKNQETGDWDYVPPTSFGYIITFGNGEIINRFPVLVNAIPDGVSPMAKLQTGNAVYTADGKISVDNSVVKTRYAVPQEVGIVYKVSTSPSVTRPVADANGWTRSPAYVSVGLNDSATYSNLITTNTTEGSTFYAAYVKTSNGYWYGDVKSISNDYKGDEDGYKILSLRADVLGDGEVLFTMDTGTTVVPYNANISFGDTLGMYQLNDLEYRTHNGKVYFVLRGLQTDRIYNLPVRVYKPSGEKSNVVSLTVNTDTSKSIYFTNKRTVDGNILFDFKMTAYDYYTSLGRCVLINSSETPLVKDLKTLSIPSSVNTKDEVVDVNMIYYISKGASGNISYDFHSRLPLY